MAAESRPALAGPLNTILLGDWIDQLATLADESVHCVVTSPPYWGLRDYNTPGQLGLESSLDDYLQKMVEGFEHVRRVLRPDGTLWLNMGDAYSTKGKWGGHSGGINTRAREGYAKAREKREWDRGGKNLLGLPWRVAFSLQNAGWCLRTDIVWHKPNPMPESVGDRPTRSHEFIFLFTRSARYYYNAEAIMEKAAGTAHARGNGVNPKAKVPSGWDTSQSNHKGKVGRYKVETGKKMQVKGGDRWSPNRNAEGARCKARWRVKQNESFAAAVRELVAERNKRSVWTVPTVPYAEAHFATFPPDLVVPCILAGCPPGGVVLDPFMGSGTVAEVAIRAGRGFIGIELNPLYVELAERRIKPLLDQSTLWPASELSP